MARPLDEIDEQLLDLLEVDARMPLKGLGAAVGLSTSAVQERLCRLKEQGAIRGFTIRREPPANVFTAYLLIKTQTANCAVVAPKIAGISEVKILDSISGNLDMIAVVEVTSQSRLSEIRDEIARLDLVNEVTTNVSLKRRIDRSRK